MTSKELLYVEDAIEHESFMKTCSCKTANQLNDVALSSYVKELETLHNQLKEKFSSLL